MLNLNMVTRKRAPNLNVAPLRFGASRLLLPVIVCAANIAIFGDFFMFRFTFEGVRFPDRSKGLLRTYY